MIRIGIEEIKHRISRALLVALEELRCVPQPTDAP